jgi:integrase
MGVKPVEIPEGSGRWYVRIRWQIAADKRFRKTKLVGAGEKGKDAAFYKAHVLNEAWTKFGAEAIKLIGPEMPGAPEKPEELEAPTVNEYGPKFLQRMRSAGLKRSTCTCYETNLRVHIYPALGQLSIDELNYRAIADFLASKADATYSTARFRAKEKNGKKKKLPPGRQHRYSRDTIRIMAMTLRAMMAEAVKDGIVPVNPVTGLSRFYRKKKSDRIVKRSDVFQTIEELHRCEDKMAERFPEYYEFTLCMSREGMRIGEVTALTVDDIDLNSGTFNINKNVPSGTGELEDSAKTDSGEREDEFWSPECLEAIRAMLKRRRIEYFQRGEEVPENLFVEKSGRRIEYSRFAKAWKKAQRLAEIGRFRTPHALRHGWASQMIAAGEDIASVSKHLGHANVGITLSIYVHFLPKKKRLPGNILDRTGAEEMAASGQA